MILADTSIWAMHLRRPDLALVRRLKAGEIVMHDYVMGELALGQFPKQEVVLRELADLPTLPVATHNEIMHFIASHRLASAGIGYVDAHLAASVLLTDEAKLWTADKRLHRVAARLSIAL